MERTQAVVRLRRWLTALFVAGALEPAIARAESGDMALALRPNVVRITAHWGDGTTQNGFGFVVGEDHGMVYIVTADHVVRGDAPEQIDKSPTIVFFQDRGKEYKGELLQTRLAPGHGDLAVLRVRPPPNVTWRRNARAAEPAKRGTEVWFVGLLGDWYVPTRSGSVNEVEPDGTIKVDDLNVRVGTSGAPLVARDGILGMVVSDADVYVEATPIEVIERAFALWSYPWQMAAGARVAVPPKPSPPAAGAAAPVQKPSVAPPPAAGATAPIQKPSPVTPPPAAGAAAPIQSPVAPPPAAALSGFSGTWTASSSGSCDYHAELTINNELVTGYVTRGSTEAVINTKLASDGRMSTYINIPHSLDSSYLEGVFPNLVVGGTTHCGAAYLSFVRVK